MLGLKRLTATTRLTMKATSMMTANTLHQRIIITALSSVGVPSSIARPLPLIMQPCPTQQYRFQSHNTGGSGDGSGHQFELDNFDDDFFFLDEMAEGDLDMDDFIPPEEKALLDEEEKKK